MSVNEFAEKLTKRINELEDEVNAYKSSIRITEQLNLMREALLTPYDLHQKLKVITDGVVEIFKADFCRIWLVKPGDRCDTGCNHLNPKEEHHACKNRHRCLHLSASSGRYTRLDGTYYSRIPLGCYMAGRIATGKNAKILINTISRNKHIHDQKWVADLGLISFAGYRICFGKDEPMGVLAVFSKHPISSHEDILLESLTNTISQVVHTASMESVLKERKERYRHLYHNALVGLFQSRIDKGTVLSCNQRFAEMAGFESIDQCIRELRIEDHYVHPDVHRRFLSEIQEKGKADNFEAQITDRHGNVHWFSYSAKLYPGEQIIEGVLIDICDRKRAEEALKKSEEKFRTIVDNAGDAIFIRDFKGRFLEVNQVACERYGYSRDEILKMTPMDLVIPEYAQKIRWRTKEIEKKGHAIFESVHVTKEGRTFPVEQSGRVIRFNGEPAIINIARDIQDRKHLEAQIRQVQKMEAVGSLAGGIAHDFNNLLMGILGSTSLMLSDIDEGHPHYEYLVDIERYVKMAVDNTKQLLGFAREGKYEVRPTNMNEVVENHNRMFGRTRKEINLHEKLAENPWTVEVDRGQIEQVLMNVCVNAGQAMPDGGEIYIQTENITLGRDYIKPFEIKPGRYVKISITDTGMGMDSETKRKIFNPFFTTKEKGRGTGMGLSSAYGIIKNHGGFINVYSEPGQGATFNIYLPASRKKVNKQVKSKEEDILKGSGKVLLIDDEPLILTVGEKLLKRLDYEVMTASNGLEGIEIYKEKKDSIDLVILDMVMPEMTGGDTYEALKRINSDVKVLLSSGYSLNGKAKEILSHGCNGFIQKPFSINQLSQKINNILNHR